MKISLILLGLFLISFSIERKKEKALQKLEGFGSAEIEFYSDNISNNTDSDITTTDLFSTDITINTYNSNNIENYTDSIPNTTNNTYYIVDSTNKIDSTNIIDTTNTTDNINTNITKVNTDYLTNLLIPSKPPKIILLGFGHFTPPSTKDDSLIVFRAYFLKLYGNISKFMFFTVKINGKEEQVNCTKIHDDEDIIQYNCSFSASENKSFDNIYINRDFKFNDMEDDFLKPYIIYSSMANETINGGLQNALDSDLDNGINILNETKLNEIELNETNELMFQLTGNIKGTISNNNTGILFFDENGDGKLKNVTCNNIINREGSLYDFNCQSDNEINAPLTGVMGITNKENKKILIYMKSENDRLNLNYDIEKYLLVGFGHFNRTETNLYFIAYVIKILGHTYPETLDLKLRIITNSSRLRILEEMTKTIQCVRITTINLNDMHLIVQLYIIPVNSIVKII